MSRSRASTPAARRRSTTRPATRRPARPFRPTTSGASSTRPGPARRTRRRRPAPRRPRRPPLLGRRRRLRARRPSSALGRWRRRTLVALVLAGALAAGYFLWLRDSSLVSVTDVTVSGVTAGDRSEIVAALTDAGEGMSTLHVEPAGVERAASRFPTIASVSLDAGFPHSLRIDVTERPPTMIAKAGGEEVPIAGDGTVLAGVQVPERISSELPVIELDKPPAEGSLGGEPLQEALVAGVAPEPLRPLIDKLHFDHEHGVVATMRGDIPVFFGTGGSPARKWAAASAVLADPSLDGLDYLDVRVPERPAAGGAVESTSSG